MDDLIEDDKLIEHVVKESKQKPTDIFELNDGRIIVNGNLFADRETFDKVLYEARKIIKVEKNINKLMFWKKKK